MQYVNQHDLVLIHNLYQAPVHFTMFPDHRESYVSYFFTRGTEPGGGSGKKPEGEGLLLDTASTLLNEVGGASVSRSDPTPPCLAFSNFSNFLRKQDNTL